MSKVLSPASKKLLDDIMSFIEKYNLTKTGFGALALGDPNLVGDMKRGREIRWPTEQKIRAAMSAYVVEKTQESETAQ